MTVLEVTSPGVEVGAVTPLRVDAGDTVAIGDVTITPSDATTMTVSGAAMNASALHIGSTEYPANTCVVYTLTVTGTVTSNVTKYIEFEYTTGAGDERIVQQEVTLLPHFEAAGGVLVFGGGLVTTLTGAPDAALYPGKYYLDMSGGAFTVELRQVKGEWLFLDSRNGTAVYNLTIGTGSQTFNGTAGPLTFDGSHLECRIVNLTGSTAYEVTL